MNCRITKVIFIVLFLLLHVQILQAQKAGKTDKRATPEKPKFEADTTSFCKMLHTLLVAAGENFTQVKGKETESTTTAVIYSASRGLPGAVTSSIVDEGALRYEGAMYQGGSKDKMAQAYILYKTAMDNCLLHAGYTVTAGKNDGKGLADFPGLRYSTSKATSHFCTLNVDYSDISSLYTITITVNK